MQSGVRYAEAQVMKAGCKACNAQDAHRVFAESGGDVMQKPFTQVCPAAGRVDERAEAVLSDRIDGMGPFRARLDGDGALRARAG